MATAMMASTSTGSPVGEKKKKARASAYFDNMGRKSMAIPLRQWRCSEGFALENRARLSITKEPEDTTTGTPYIDVVLIGRKGTGKTSFLDRFHSSARAIYTSHVDKKVYSIKYPTNKGLAFNFKLHEVDYMPQFPKSVFSEYDKNMIKKAKAILLFGDMTSRVSLRDQNDIIRETRNIQEGQGQVVPVMLMGSKVDVLCENMMTRKEPLAALTSYIKNEQYPFVDLSSLANHNVHMPFFSLGHMYWVNLQPEDIDNLKRKNPEWKLDRETDLEFTSLPNLVEPEITMDPIYTEKLEELESKIEEEKEKKEKERENQDSSD